MGQSTTTLYELVPEYKNRATNDSRALYAGEPGDPAVSIEISYREPVGEKRKQITHNVFLTESIDQEPSETFRFAAGVARFGMMLKNPDIKDKNRIDMLRTETKKSILKDPDGIKKELLKLMDAYKKLLR
jgi:Ca-activated chloride channel family protein